MSFLPELVLLAGALVLFVISLGELRGELARKAALATAVVFIAACIASLGQDMLLFSGAYRVDAFSQLLKLIFGIGFLLVVLSGGSLPDIRTEVKPEYFFLLASSVTGLVMLVSCVEVISLVISLELSSFPLFLMVPMRRERGGQHVQMECAVKYIMFGVAANGIMFFGLSYLFGLTGTLHLPELARRVPSIMESPLAITGFALTFCGIYYKLAVFPFHFWSPDVYEGSAHETAAVIASLPKIGAIAVMVRFVSLVNPGHETIALMLAVLAGASMLYGNLIALAQKDFKRLLGFSAIAHAGYAMIGFVALSPAGYAAAIYYMTGYLFMILACFAVIGRVSRDGANVAIEDLAGLHRRAPLLAATLAVGVFGLAGVPPFAGFMGKLTLLKCALDQGHLALVILAVVNTAIAIYYYLQVVREAYFKDAVDATPIPVCVSTKFLCAVLIAGTVLLGVAPGPILDRLSAALTNVATLAAR
ncbi:MAG: NADH-quinone oxidoreductase subunit N [bacterium]